MRLVPFKKQNKELMPSWPLFDDFLDKFFNEDLVNDSKIMAVDVVETENFFNIKANLPGIIKEKVKISLKENQLLIEASHEENKEEKSASVIRSERYSGKYQRYISLPDNCDGEKIKAKLENGVLDIQIPKKEPIPKKEIIIE